VTLGTQETLDSDARKAHTRDMSNRNAKSTQSLGTQIGAIIDSYAVHRAYVAEHGEANEGFVAMFQAVFSAASDQAKRLSLPALRELGATGV